MLEKTEGIILKTIKYGDSSLIVKIFTEKFGLIPVIFKGIRNSKKKEANILQPGFIIDIFIYYKQNKNILLSKEKNLHYLYQSVTQDMSKMSVVYFVIELIAHCTKEHQINHEEYYFLKNFLIQIDNDKQSVEYYPILFMHHFSYLLGFKPLSATQTENQYFNLEKGTFESIPQPNIHLDKECSKLLLKMLIALDNNEVLVFNASDRQKLLDAWISYYQFQVPEFKQLQTPNILHELLH